MLLTKKSRKMKNVESNELYLGNTAELPDTHDK